MVTRTEAIANMLKLSTHEDLANLYDFNMEVQVNVSQGNRSSVERNGPDGQMAKKHGSHSVFHIMLRRTQNTKTRRCPST